MREIKFRLWNEEQEVLQQLEQLNCYNWTDKFTHPNGVIMQYTGLKDKNGKEIYEFDIVEGHTFDEQIEKKQTGSIEYNEERHGFVFVPFDLKPKNLYYPLFAIVTCEVVGNIYENPELMEVSA